MDSFSAPRRACPSGATAWPTPFSVRWLTLAMLLLASSCASVPELPWSPVAKDVSAGFYNTARLEYRLDAGKIGQPLDVLRVDGRQVNFEQVASSPLPDRSVGTLVVQKPHPAGREGFARVTFSIDSADTSRDGQAWNPLKLVATPAPKFGHHEEVHEIWAMDLPAAEADLLFQGLSSQNFYNGKEPPDAPAQVSVTLDGKAVNKRWEMLPELNALAQRVRSQGRLVAYLRPDALSGETANGFAGVQAYRDLLARTGTATGTVPATATGVLAERPSTANNDLPYATR